MLPYEKSNIANLTDAEKHRVWRELISGEAYAKAHRKKTIYDPDAPDYSCIKRVQQGDISEDWSKKPVHKFFHDIQFAQGERVLEWNLPGHGTAYPSVVDPDGTVVKKGCGEVFVTGCPDAHAHLDGKGKGEKVKQGCKRLSCPTCYESAASHRALKALTRFGTFFYGRVPLEKHLHKASHELRHKRVSVVKKALIFDMEQLCKVRTQPVKHIVASPPQNSTWEQKKAFLSNRKLAYRILKRSGAKGGAVIIHPYRLKCGHCGHHPIPDHKTKCPKCHHSDFLWYFSPHFHMIGFGWINRRKDEYQNTGWVVKNLGIRDSVYATFQYLLSHCGVAKGVQTISWFGNMSIRQIKGGQAKLPTLRHYCDECDVAYSVLTWNHTDRPPPMLTFADDDRLNEFRFSAGEYVSKHKL